MIFLQSHKIDTMNADLYIDRIDILKYLPMKDCYECGYSCKEFSEKLKKNPEIIDRCPYLNARYKEFLKIAVNADKVLPKVPVIPSTVKTKTGLIKGDENTPILVTANYPYTQMVIGEVLAKAGINCNLLIIDTDGYAVDMAVYLKIFNGKRVRDAIKELTNSSKKILVIPGLAEEFKDDIEKKTGWKVIVGPICAAEIPIFLLSNGLI